MKRGLEQVSLNWKPRVQFKEILHQMKFQSLSNTHLDTSHRVFIIILFINQTIDPNHEIIALNFGKDMIKSFIANLNKLMSVIREKTGKLLVPFAVQSSLLNTSTEMTVIMRTVQNF